MWRNYDVAGLLQHTRMHAASPGVAAFSQAAEVMPPTASLDFFILGALPAPLPAPPMHAMCCHTCVEQGPCCLSRPHPCSVCHPLLSKLPWLSRPPSFPAAIASPFRSLPLPISWYPPTVPANSFPIHARRESPQTQHALLIPPALLLRLLSNHPPPPPVTPPSLPAFRTGLFSSPES